MLTRFLLVLALLLVSCADKNYVSVPASGAGGENKPGSCQMTCTARFQTSRFCFSHAWEKMPTEKDFGSFTFKISRDNAFDQTMVMHDFSDPVTVILWMPSMGHGSSPVTLERIDTGTYRASRVFFSMPGEWELRVQVKNGTDVKDQAVINLKI